jgi:ATP-dependent metalloprotease
MKHLEFARDKVLMGPAKKSKIPDAETNNITAYHEAGHTIVRYFTNDADPLHKVTIVPRGQALGFTSHIPIKEAYNRTKSQLLAEMDVMMAGRVAEEQIFGMDNITTGAASDFNQATKLATNMVILFCYFYLKSFFVFLKIGETIWYVRKSWYTIISRRRTRCWFRFCSC